MEMYENIKLKVSKNGRMEGMEPSSASKKALNDGIPVDNFGTSFIKNA